jgi:ADP-ribose pyrophosphatase YjhB (NUDIX family)
MSSDNRSPRVGCGAAILRDSKLLLVKHKRPPETNHLGLPGGKVVWLAPSRERSFTLRPVDQAHSDFGVCSRCR